MTPGFLQSVGHTIFRIGGGGDGNATRPEDSGPLRLGHSGEPLYTTLAGHPVSDDNNRYRSSIHPSIPDLSSRR
jgi:hypothetical protein